LIPLLSFIILRGKCASCHKRIPARYPAVEAVCGALWAAMYWRFAVSFQFICYALLGTILIAVFFIDLEWMRIPNRLVLCAIVPSAAAALRYAFILAPPERFRSLYNGVHAAEPLLGLIPCAFFLLIYIITSAAGGGKSAVGMGDVKLLLPAGLALGLRLCAFAVFIAVILGGVTGAALILTKRKTKKDPIPFGPFLVFGVLAAVIFPYQFLF